MSSDLLRLYFAVVDRYAALVPGGGQVLPLLNGSKHYVAAFGDGDRKVKVSFPATPSDVNGWRSFKRDVRVKLRKAGMLPALKPMPQPSPIPTSESPVQQVCYDCKRLRRENADLRCQKERVVAERDEERARLRSLMPDKIEHRISERQSVVDQLTAKASAQAAKIDSLNAELAQAKAQATKLVSISDDTSKKRIESLGRKLAEEKAVRRAEKYYLDSATLLLGGELPPPSELRTTEARAKSLIHSAWGQGYLSAVSVVSVPEGKFGSSCMAQHPGNGNAMFVAQRVLRMGFVQFLHISLQDCFFGRHRAVPQTSTELTRKITETADKLAEKVCVNYRLLDSPEVLDLIAAAVWETEMGR